MRRILAAITLAAAALCAAGALGHGARAQTAPSQEKARDIERLLRAMRAGELGVQMVEELMPEMMGMFEMSLASMPGVKREQAKRILEEEMRKEFTAEKTVAALVPIYDKYLSAEEVKTLLAFWESPAGAKFASVQPQILRESSNAGAGLAMVVATRAIQRMAAEGVYASAPPARPARRAPARRRRN